MPPESPAQYHHENSGSIANEHGVLAAGAQLSAGRDITILSGSTSRENPGRWGERLTGGQTPLPHQAPGDVASALKRTGLCMLSLVESPENLKNPSCAVCGFLEKERWMVVEKIFSILDRR
jgi:hypothetical protein